MITPGVYLSSSYRRTATIETILRELGEREVRDVELSGGTDHIPDILGTLKVLQRAYGFRFLIHNYFPPPPRHFILNIAAEDPALRARSVEFAKQSMSLASELGIDLYTVHAGYLTPLNPGKDSDFFEVVNERILASRRESLARMMESLETLERHAARLGMRLALENLFPANKRLNFSLLCDPEEVEWFLRQVAGLEQIGFLVDFGHANVSAYYMKFSLVELLDLLMVEFRPRIFEVHVSHNDGTKDEHATFTASSWLVPILRRYDLRALPVVLESRARSADRALEELRLLRTIVLGERAGGGAAT